MVHSLFETFAGGVQLNYQFLEMDARDAADLRAQAVYADPPYYGNENLYNTDRFDPADLIPVNCVNRKKPSMDKMIAAGHMNHRPACLMNF